MRKENTDVNMSKSEQEYSAYKKSKRLFISSCVFAVLSLIVCVIGNYVSIGFFYKPDGLEALAYIVLIPIMVGAYVCQLIFSIVSISCSSSIVKVGSEHKGGAVALIITEAITMLFSLACLVAMLVFGQG